MSLYFLLLDADAFHQQIIPPLAQSWRQKSFAPCRVVCESLLPVVAAFEEHYGHGNEPILRAVLRGLGFHKQFWRALVGEVLWYAAAETPLLQTAAETLAYLLAGRPAGQRPPREHFAPIEQAHYGRRNLVFGRAFYRPDAAGFNDRDDVVALAAYLEGIDPQAWQACQLAGLPDLPKADRDEELAYAQECFASLRDIHRQAADTGRLIVCEDV